MESIKNIAEAIIAGKHLTRDDNLQFLLDGDLEELGKYANIIREHFCGNKMNLCSIVNGRSGKCSEDCKYCAQSAHHETAIKEYPFLEPDEIIKQCKENADAGVHRFAVVTSGRYLRGDDLEKALIAYRKMSKECDIELCASHGLLEEEEFVALKAAGVSRYHENIETSRKNFHNICTTHTYEDKVRCIKLAKKAGLQVCSGGIIGMNENYEDRIDMAFDLAELEVESIPINVLMAIKGTPFEYMDRLSPEEILRSLIIFRYINPEAEIRLAAGRILMKNSGEKAFESGINATITGNMLTTSGNNIAEDMEMFKNMGFDLSK